MKNRLIFNSLAVLFASLSIIVFSSCEQEFTPGDVKAKEAYVVEGHIELSDIDIPAYVILSKSISYFSTFDTSSFKQLYIDDAEVYVNDGEKSVKLQYVCLNELDPLTGFKILSDAGDKILSTDFCLYIDRNNELIKETGRTYELTIYHEGNRINSLTTMTGRVELDSIFFKDPPGIIIDTMTLLWVRVSDPADEENYYIYDVRSLNFGRKFGNTLRDGSIFRGQTIELPLPNPYLYRDSEFSPETVSLYKRGDTLLLKWCTIDLAHFEFWQSFAFSNNQGPFSSYVRAKDNIDGGIGIWGARNCQVEILIVE
jgi:hypothetical protein